MWWVIVGAARAVWQKQVRSCVAFVAAVASNSHLNPIVLLFLIDAAFVCHCLL